MKQKEQLKVLKVTRPTLFKYVKSGKIRQVKLDNGYWNYNDDDVFRMQGKSKKRMNVIYQRVSTKKQKNDLDNQVKEIETYCIQNGVSIDKIYKDIGSGIELDKRKQFLELIQLVTEFKVKTIYITYKDRLTRIQFNTFKELFKIFGTDIEVLHKQNDDGKEYEKEIFSELISIIYVFQMKMYSKRRRKKIEMLAEEQEYVKKLDDKVNNE